MSVWINARESKYGLEIAAGHADGDPKAAEFQLGRDLEIEVSNAPIGGARQVRNEITLRFGPDGFMDENNPQTITIKEKNGESVIVAPNRNRLNYEIITNSFYTIRR